MRSEDLGVEPSGIETGFLELILHGKHLSIF